MNRGRTLARPSSPCLCRFHKLPFLDHPHPHGTGYQYTTVSSSDWAARGVQVRVVGSVRIRYPCPSNSYLVSISVHLMTSWRDVPRRPSSGCGSIRFNLDWSIPTRFRVDLIRFSYSSSDFWLDFLPSSGLVRFEPVRFSSVQVGLSWHRSFIQSSGSSNFRFGLFSLSGPVLLVPGQSELTGYRVFIHSSYSFSDFRFTLFLVSGSVRSGPVRCDSSFSGPVWYGTSSSDLRFPILLVSGSVRFGPVRFGPVRCDSSFSGSVRSGSVGNVFFRFPVSYSSCFRFGSVRSGPVRFGPVRCDSSFSGSVRSGSVGNVFFRFPVSYSSCFRFGSVRFGRQHNPQISGFLFFLFPVRFGPVRFGPVRCDSSFSGSVRSGPV